MAETTGGKTSRPNYRSDELVSLGLFASCQQRLRRFVAGFAGILASISILTGAVSGAESRAFLFAADGNLNLIHQYDLSGNEFRQITNGQFDFPTLLTADSSTGSLITDINFAGRDAPSLVRFDFQ